MRPVTRGETVMPRQTRTLSERDHQLQQVVLEYLQAVDSGVAPSPEEVLARHPDLVVELTQFFNDQDGMCSLLVPLRQLRGGAADELAPSRLGSYRILRPVGRGGMG